MIIVIGREKNSKLSGAVKIVIPKPQVSGDHLLVAPNDDSISIEDLNSTNGTYLNDLRIKRGKFTEADTLNLADVNISYSFLRGEITKIQKSQRDDFTEEFSELQAVFTAYKEKVKVTKDGYNRKNQIIRACISLIPILVGFYFFDKANYMAFSIASTVGGTLFGVLQLYNPLGGKTLEEQIDELREEFQIRYRCPKCGVPYGEQSWKVLSQQKQCRACKAIWVQ